MVLALEELLMFPFFGSLSFWCVGNSTLNANNPITVPLAAKSKASLLLHGDLDQCNAKCSFEQWMNFIHFSINADAQMCSGNGKYCDCKSALCIGDTVALQGATGRYGTLQVPYSVPVDGQPRNKQWSWLEFCRDDFPSTGADVVCQHMNFSRHEYSDLKFQLNGLEPLPAPRDNDPGNPFFLPYTVDCTGKEASLSSCKFKPLTSLLTTCTGPTNIYCRHGAKARLAYPSLTGSCDPEDSELLVFMNDIGQWSTVCSKDWTAQDNSLACEMAGRIDPFDKAQARSCWEHWYNHMQLDWKAHSGYYLIYSEQLERVFPVHCDMETDGGGWTLVLAAKYGDEPNDWTADTIIRKNRYDPEPDKDFSILDLADSLQIGNNPEFLITVRSRNGTNSSLLQVRYPKGYSMMNTSQQTANLVIVNQINITLDNSSAPAYPGFGLGMPWVYVSNTSLTDSWYTMQPLQAPSVLQTTSSSPSVSPTTSAASTASPVTAPSLATTVSSSSPNVLLTSGVLAGTGSTRVFDPRIPGGRVNIYVRTKNLRIKEAPIINCKNMDYLLDGNRYLANAHFTSSSLLVNDPAIHKEPYYNLNAHNSYLAEPFNETKGGGGWVTSTSDTRSWISVDLLTPHKLTAVVTSGAEVYLGSPATTTKQDTWISSFILWTTSSQVGDKEPTATLVMNSTANGARAFVSRNTDSAATITTSRFPAVDNVRFVKLNPTVEQHHKLQVSGTPHAPDSRQAFGLRWELIGCSKQPRNQDHYILDDLKPDALGIKNMPTDYRMGAAAEKIWLARTCIDTQLQIRFPEMYLIRSIVLAGHSNYPSLVVGTFRLMFSKSGSQEHLQWLGLRSDTNNPTDSNEERKYFPGPIQGAEPQFINLEHPFSARLVRFIVTGSNTPSCYIRLEFIGRPLRDGCMIPLGMISGEINDFQLTSSSQYVPACKTGDSACQIWYGPERARFNSVTDSRGFGAWRPAVHDKSPWIGVDFRQKVQINAVIIGQYDLSYVDKFRLTESDDNDVWYNYTLQLEDMTENIGTYTIFYLSPPIYSRYLRIHPLTFKSFGIFPERYVKFELLGCKVASEVHSRVPQFSNFRHMELYPNRHYDSYWYNHTNVVCAEKCLSERGFVCRGYYYNALNSTCVLSAANQKSWDVSGYKLQLNVNFYEREIACSKDMGLINPNLVKDSQFTASSNHRNASSARLLQKADGYYKKGWLADGKETKPWLQVNMTRQIRLTGLHLNGDGIKGFVKNFTIMSSLDGVNWINCCGGFNPLYLNGSTQAVVPETVWLQPRFHLDGQFFRIYPVHTSARDRPVAFQVEFIGCVMTNEKPKYPMAFQRMKCTGREERMEDCKVKISDPNDKYCKLETAVRPKCLAHCGDPGLKACAIRTGLNFFHPHKVTFACLDGTEPHDVRCEENGFWSSPGPNCVKQMERNVAFQKNTTQSSTARLPSVQVASKAVDGDPELNAVTCSLTNPEMKPWWFVDLRRTYEISRIEVSPGFGFESVEIRVGKTTPFQADGSVDITVNPVCADSQGAPPTFDQEKKTLNYVCSSMPVFGQYVSLQAHSENTPSQLSLCEVRVIAKPCTVDDTDDQAVFSSMYLSPLGNSTGSTVAVAEDPNQVQVGENIEMCKRTAKRVHPYWVAISGGQLSVTNLTIEPARDSAGQLHDFEVLVGEYAMEKDFYKNVQCYNHNGKVILPAGQKSLQIPCVRELYGSYVIIRIHSDLPSVLALCSVKVWGRLCHTVLDGTVMHPLLSSSGTNDIWVLLTDEEACFKTDAEVSPWVGLDMIFATEMYTAEFKLCDNMITGKLEIRVWDDPKMAKYSVMVTDVAVTSEQSKSVYQIKAPEWPYPSGRYLSIHLLPDPSGKLQALCICHIDIVRDRYCPKNYYHNVAYGQKAVSSSILPPQSLITVTTDGETQMLPHLCFSTKIERNPYWVLNLPAVMKIYTIRFTGRQNSNREVRIGSASDWRTNPLCLMIDNKSYVVSSYMGSCVDSETGMPKVGSVISIAVSDDVATALYICEVEVWGYKAEPPNT